MTNSVVRITNAWLFKLSNSNAEMIASNFVIAFGNFEMIYALCLANPTKFIRINKTGTLKYVLLMSFEAECIYRKPLQ